MVPESFGVLTGLLGSGGALPPNASTVSIGGIGGSITAIKLSGVSLDVEGVPMTEDVLFHPNPNSRSLLGRNAIVALANVGFNATD